MAAYLDALRLTLALAVMLHHLSWQRLTGGLFWQLGRIGPPRVVLFFVVSGFLMAWVASRPDATRPGGGMRFAEARVARFASVALPALAMTAGLDAAGAWLRPDLYADVPSLLSALALEQYLRALTLTHMGWFAPGGPGSNWAYWTLGIEASCCLVFGLMVFTSGWTRVGCVAAALVAIGPAAASLVPVWLMGAAAYRLGTDCTPGPRAAWALALLPVAAWLAWEGALLVMDGMPEPRGLPQDDLFLSYTVAAGTAMHLAGVRVLLEGVAMPGWVSGPLRWAAGATFTLFLLHMPLARFLSAVSPWEPASWANRVLIVGGVIVAAFLLAELSERRRDWWRDATGHGFAGVEATWMGARRTVAGWA